MGAVCQFAGEDRMFQLVSVDKAGLSMKPLDGGATLTVAPGPKVIRIEPSDSMSREVNRQTTAEQRLFDAHVAEQAKVLAEKTDRMNRRQATWLGGRVPEHR